MKVDPLHIGDGVYVSFDGFHIEIRVNDHRSHPVAFLEPAVMEELIKYYNRLKESYYGAADT